MKTKHTYTHRLQSNNGWIDEEYTATWTDHTIRCCGQTLRLIGAEFVPLMQVDHHGDVNEVTYVQCSNCGSQNQPVIRCRPA